MSLVANLRWLPASFKALLLAYVRISLFYNSHRCDWQRTKKRRIRHDPFDPQKYKLSRQPLRLFHNYAPLRVTSLF